MARSAVSRRSRRGQALLLGKSRGREADAILTLLTPEWGRLVTVARSGLRSQRRFAGALEPFHLLSVEVEESGTSDLLALREAAILVPRVRLMGDLGGMQAAGRFLGWVKRVAGEHSDESALFALTDGLLGDLDARETKGEPLIRLAEAGLAMLTLVGLGLELERCVRTGRPCPPGQPSLLDPRAGGLVSRAAGGGPILLSGEQRGRLAEAASGASGVLLPTDAALALEILEGVLDAHAPGQKPSRPSDRSR